MKKIYVLLCAILATATLRAQLVVNGQLDHIEEFSTKYTVPFVMPDGVKLYTDVYMPRTRDSLRVSLGEIDLLGITTIQTDTITFIENGAQILIYDSINGQPNPDPYQLPTIYTRTPYDKGDFDELGGILPILGYNYMLQDMRGRYSSEGVYFPMYSDSWNKNAYHPGGHILDYLPTTDPKHSNKHEDGYNSVKIISELTIPGIYDGLPHTNEKINNGTIGMFGASALGNTQLQLGAAHYVPDSLPHLRCLMPIVATVEHYTSTGYNNGTFRDRIVTGWLKGQIFSGTEDDLIPIDNDKQNSIHSSYDYDLPKSITVNGITRQYEQNKFEAANISIDHFTAMRYNRQDGTLAPAGFYPNSVGRPDMDASVAPVNINGESVDMATQQRLPDLNYSRYRNLDLPILHIYGWWDIFTEGQMNTHNFTTQAMQERGSPNQYLQKSVIGPWAHQTIASRRSGDRTYQKNVTDLTKIDLSDFNINDVPINDILKSDLITWFRFNLNNASDYKVGEPKALLRESQQWQHFGYSALLGGDVLIRVPSKDLIIPFIDLINFLGGKGDLKGLKFELKTNTLPAFEITQDIPGDNEILGQFGGDKLETIPSRDFRDSVPNWRVYVAGPDSASDAITGYADNYKIGNYWFNSDVFPPSQNIYWKKLYLHQDGSFNESAPTQDEGYKMYVSDPDDPILTVGGANMIVRSPDGTRNSQSQMELSAPENNPYTMDREGVIQFNSDVIQDSFTIIGLPVCTLYAKSNPGGVTSGPTDCDWNIRICDVWPDGRVYYVQEGIVNARGREWARALVDQMGVVGAATYANGVEDPGDKDIPYTNIETGQIYEYVFKMMPIGYCFAKGHRIRVLINSTNYTRYQANPQIPLNDGEFFRRKPGDGQTYWYNGVELDPRVAVQRVHFSPQHPTSINFPMYDVNYIYNGVNPVAVDAKFDATVFPNPAADKVQILVNQPGEHLVIITDVTGREIARNTFDDNIIYNTKQFGQGIYFATISDVKNPSAKITKKFTVQ